MKCNKAASLNLSGTSDYHDFRRLARSGSRSERCCSNCNPQHGLRKLEGFFQYHELGPRANKRTKSVSRTLYLFISSRIRTIPARPTRLAEVCEECTLSRKSTRTGSRFWCYQNWARLINSLFGLYVRKRRDRRQFLSPDSVACRWLKSAQVGRPLKNVAHISTIIASIPRRWTCIWCQSISYIIM